METTGNLYFLSDTILTPTKCTISIIYIHLMCICYMFRCVCTVIRENNCASSWKSNYCCESVTFELNSVAYVSWTWICYKRYHCTWEGEVAQSVEALRYKSGGRGFDSRWLFGIFHWHNPSDRTVARDRLGTRNTSWGAKAAGALGWQPYQVHAPTVLTYGSLNLLEPSGSVQACTGDCFTFNVYNCTW
jgi:hypothetical protein